MKTRRSGIFVALMTMMVMLAPGVAAAQTPATTIPFTITVTGEASANAPAEEAMVVITLGTDGSAYYDPMTGMPIETAEPMEIDATPVVDAIVAQGIPAGSIEVSETPFTGEWGSGNMPLPVLVIVTVPQPTVEGLIDLLDVVRTAAAEDGIFVNQFGVMYSVADCRVLRQQARADAVANARIEAEDQAVALDTTVGSVVASKDVMPTGTFSYQFDSCSQGAPMMKPFTPIYATSAFDPRLPAEVSVTVAVEISWEIP